MNNESMCNDELNQYNLKLNEYVQSFLNELYQEQDENYHLKLLQKLDTELFNRHDTMPIDTNNDDFVSSALKLGMQPIKQLTTIPFSKKLHDHLSITNTKFILEIGSGKGYLSRILANHYNFKTCSVDMNETRVKSSLRISRLIKPVHMDISGQFPGSVKNQFISGNLMSINKEINTLSDFEHVITEQAVPFYKRGQPVGTMEFPIGLTALNICGDLSYSLIEYASNLKLKGVQIESIGFVPCCFHQITDFPKSMKLKGIAGDMDLKLIGEKLYNSLVLVDLNLMLEENGFCNRSVGYLNQGYYYLFANSTA